MQAITHAGPVKHQGIILLLIIASYFMIVVDVSIVITGLPKIQQSLGFSTAELSWVQNAYTLSFGGLLLLGARAGDLFGRRRMYITGLALFTLASLAIGLAFLPATLAQLAASFAVPYLTRLLGLAGLMVMALLVTIAGLLWLGMAPVHGHYLSNVALPMLLIGLGNGALLAPLTMAAVEGVPHQDAGAASGVVNMVHQMGGALGLSVLVVVFSMAHASGPAAMDGAAAAILAHRISAVMNTSAFLLFLSLMVLVVMLVIPAWQRPRPKKAWT